MCCSLPRFPDWQATGTFITPSSCHLQVVRLKKAALFSPHQAGTAGTDVSACRPFQMTSPRRLLLCCGPPGAHPHTTGHVHTRAVT